MTLIIAVIAACMGALWLTSLPLKNSSIVDIFWGTGFVIVAWLSWWQAPPSARGTLMSALVTVWGLRLTAYLAWRNLGKGEDPRYTAMRNRHGAAWWWRSLPIVFVLQGVLVLIIGVPVNQAIMRGGELGPFDVAGAALVLVGVAFETIGDLQLAAFKRTNHGKVMDRGLWRYTRHPNYFGDAVTWWGLFTVALGAGAWWAVFSPVLMTTLLVRVSGVSLLEKTMKKRPGYDEYTRRTSSFFPRPPKP
jgi:steroid 5-alpha reductase family enzyme